MRRRRIAAAATAAVLAGLMILGSICSADDTVSSAEVSPVTESVDMGSKTENPEGENPEGENPEGENPEEEIPEEELVVLSGIHFAKDYTEVYETLKKAENNYYRIYDYVVEEDVDYAAPVTGVASNMESAKDTGADYSAADYSDTNVRTEGVDEADVVKTDGAYIYILKKHSELVIVEAKGAKMNQVSRIHIADADDWHTQGGQEFFVSGNTLMVICEEYREDEFYFSGSASKQTRIQTYDISDPASPVKTGETLQYGSYLQARMRDGCMYVFTQWRPELGSYEADSMIRACAGGKEIEAGQICIPDIVTDANYLIVSSVDPQSPSEVKDTKVLISGAEQLYVSTENIYALNVDYSETKERTEIVKFTYGNGSIDGIAAGTVRGTVNDSFSIDEYDGYLRVLTTYTGSIRISILELLSDLIGFDYYAGDRWTRHNALFVLDDSLHLVSRIVDLAKEEEIHSARFFGDTGYFVTFRNMDPLFTVDLSDPKLPKITDQLKIPGFSEYLHPFGDGTLLGLGYDADEETGTITGIKISVFNLTGPEGVTETDKAIIKNVTYLPVLNDYKAVFADAGKQLVGFYLDDRFFVYHLSENSGFERVLHYDLFEDDMQGTSNFDEIRGLYIGNTFYVAGSGGVTAFDMENGFAYLGTLHLQ